MEANASAQPGARVNPLAIMAWLVGALIVVGILVWQGATAAGSPDPTVAGMNTPVATLDIATLVFREGLECVLVLAAITAGLANGNASYRKPIGVGVIFGFVATLITWFIATHLVDDLLGDVNALALQAWTGLLAIVVLLIVMNWFFHKVYWTGWISFHNRRKSQLLKEAKAKEPGSSQLSALWGLGLLGFASFYREGFEVVLFLQSYRLRMGDGTVLSGAVLGGFFAAIVAALTFSSNRKLPYKRMLIVTGVLLVFVLIMMVGEQVNEMQLAGWIGATPIGWLQWLPAWAGVWFSLFPNLQTVGAQILTVVIVLGCYFVSRYQAISLPKRRGVQPFEQRAAHPTLEAEPAAQGI